MAKKDDNMNKKLIIIILIIAIIASLGYLITRIRDRNLKDYTTSEDFSAYYAAETIRPRNLSELYGYKGQYELNDLYMGLRSFVNYVSRLKVKLIDVNDAEEPVNFNVGLATKSSNKVVVKFTMESNNKVNDSEEAKKYRNELIQKDNPGGNAEF